MRHFVGCSTFNSANWHQNRNGYNTRGQYGKRYIYANAGGNSTTTALYNAPARFLVIRYR